MAKVKRGYNTEFKAHGKSGKRYLIDDIPAGFWSDVRAMAKTEGFSLRGLILTLLKLWLENEGIRQTAKGKAQ